MATEEIGQANLDDGYIEQHDGMRISEQDQRLRHRRGAGSGGQSFDRNERVPGWSDLSGR